MTLEGEGTIYEHAKGRIVLYIPATVHRDSQFPFKVREKVKIRITGRKLVAEKIKK